MSYRIITISSILLALQSGIVLAGSTLQGNAEVSYDTTDYSSNDKETIMGLSYEYALEPVEKKSHPWREAAFLERTPTVDVEADINTYKPYNSQKFDGNTYTLTGTYLSKSNPLIGMLLYNHTDMNADFMTTSVDQTLNQLGIGAGAFLNKSFSIALLYVNSSVKTSINNPSTSTKDKSTAYSLFGKYVYELPQQKAFDLEMQISNFDYKPDNQPTESNNSIDLKAVYYIDPKIGIGGQLTKQSGDTNSYKGTRYALGVDAFVTENTSVTVLYRNFSADNSAGDDSKEWKLSAAWWF